MSQPISHQERICDASRNRFRARWVVVIVSLCLLLIIAPVVWIAFRPLTDTEQRLVGTWRNTTHPAVFTFHSNRTVTAPGFPSGVWYVRENKLYSPDSVIAETIRMLLRRPVDHSSELKFVDDNNLSIFTPVNGEVCRWQRVAQE